MGGWRARRDGHSANPYYLLSSCSLRLGSLPSLRTTSECAVKPSNYQTWGSCTIPQSPNWLPNLPKPGPRLTRCLTQAAQAPHGRLLRWPDSASRAVTACAHSMSPNARNGQEAAGAGGRDLGYLTADRAGRAWRGGACGRGLRGARSVWDVRDARTMRAVSRVQPRTVPDESLKNAFVGCG